MSVIVPGSLVNLPACPRPGSGVNRWLMSAANRLRWQGVSQSEAEDYLRANMTRQPSRMEVEGAAAKVYGENWDGVRSKPVSRAYIASTPKLPVPRKEQADPHLIREAVTIGPSQADLKGLSPVMPIGRSTTETVVRALFPPSALLCCAKGKDYGAETRPMSQFLGHFFGFNFIVPQTMSALVGLTQKGKESPHAKVNIGPWRFFVYESDTESLDTQAAVIYKLMHDQPLALVVFSGSRSLQGWFYVGHLNERERLNFQCLAIRLGGCTGPLWDAQLVRMPSGWNSKTRAVQEVVYFNPEAVKS
jgi:hypothetical protein